MGDLGNIEVDDGGVTNINIEDELVTLNGDTRGRLFEALFSANYVINEIITYLL